jgi:hypothetical protein
VLADLLQTQAQAELAFEECASQLREAAPRHEQRHCRVNAHIGVEEAGMQQQRLAHGHARECEDHQRTCDPTSLDGC